MSDIKKREKKKAISIQHWILLHYEAIRTNDFLMIVITKCALA